jgi:uncharacterized protein YmfQ (DUF2313 family)
MSAHKEILQLLFPLELGGVHDADQTVEGALFDRVQEQIAALQVEMFADTCGQYIDRWERRYGITPNQALTLQQRRAQVLARKNARGSLSTPYFIDLAATLGYTVTIDEAVDGDRYKWRVNIPAGTNDYQFRAGESAAGESLLDWPDSTGIEALFTELKPADTTVLFAYV